MYKNVISLPFRYDWNDKLSLIEKNLLQVQEIRLTPVIYIIFRALLLYAFVGKQSEAKLFGKQQSPERTTNIVHFGDMTFLLS